MKKILLIGGVLLGTTLLSGCFESANVKEVVNDNGNAIAKLLTVDGCSLYRTRDYGDRIYFTICNKDREAFTKFKVQVDDDQEREMAVPTGVTP